MLASSSRASIAVQQPIAATLPVSLYQLGLALSTLPPAGVVSYALMSFLMTTAPMAKVSCGHSVGWAKINTGMLPLMALVLVLLAMQGRVPAPAAPRRPDADAAAALSLTKRKQISHMQHWFQADSMVSRTPQPVCRPRDSIVCVQAQLQKLLQRALVRRYTRG